MTDMLDNINEVPRQICEAAAMWFLKWHSRSLTSDERKAYALWLKRSPVHIAEMLRVCRLYSRFRWARPFEFGECTDDSVTRLEFTRQHLQPLR